MIDWEQITDHTHVPYTGTFIKCPCGEVIRVFHFAWSAIQCISCRNMINKNDWKVAA